jgi:asparagine synthase (glutamine-hydrolysing)
MCGLTGFYDRNASRPVSEQVTVVRAMTDSLRHRGPDSGATWHDTHAPMFLGHRRLSIQDLSDSGAQPMTSASGRYTLAYNGEIYNAPELRATLGVQGIVFRGSSDTEALLNAIESWGLNIALQKINGMFAFVLWDAETRQIHFARDRFGKKPLYIGWAGDTLLFASELKAFRAHPDFKPAVNKQALSLYMRYAAVPAPHCIYENVWSLLPASRLSLKAQSLQTEENLAARMEIYWHADKIATESHAHLFKGDENAAIDEFERLLTQATQDRLLSDVPLGAFLSGGIDSSTIVALMQKNSSQPVKTYTIGFEEAGFDEAAYARQVASHLGTDHHEHYVTQKDALDLIPQLPEIYDEPFADISAIPTVLVSRFARKDVTVVLSGDGGDEILGGYNRHIKAPQLWSYLKYMPESLVGSFLPHNSAMANKLRGLIGEKDASRAYNNLLSHWEEENDALDNIVHPALSFAENMMLWDTQGYLPRSILTKVDRASMACSLEARAPLLDRRIFEYVWSLPLKYKIRGGKGKWLLRQVLQKHVPAELFERPKQGFSIPVSEWLRRDLRDWGQDLLENNVELIDIDQIRSVWAAHQSGQADHGTKLWTALMFLAWYKKWM